MNTSPLFCPKCSEIRGTELNTGTLLWSNEELYFTSFGMCTKCKEFLNNNSKEIIKKNRIEYKRKLILSKVSTNIISTGNFELYYVDDEKISTLLYINNAITPYKFSALNLSKVNPETNQEHYTVHKLEKSISECEKDKIVPILQKNDIVYWIESIK